MSYIVAAYKKSKNYENLLVASLLHDTLEDTDTTFELLVKEFNPMVASLVLELSNNEEEIKKLGKLEYQKKKLKGMSSYALVIKLADRLHNISDLPTAKMVKDTIELMDYILKARKLSLTQKKLVSAILIECKGDK